MNIIKCLVMDVDGTLTDGKVYIGNNGELMKAFSIKDGFGIHDILIPLGIEPVIITGRESQIVENRCKELGINKLFQGVKDKLSVLKTYLSSRGLEFHNVSYIGDDLNDLSCMLEIKRNGGIVACPLDAHRSVKEIANYISQYNGGQGAVRDFIEFISK